MTFVANSLEQFSPPDEPAQPQRFAFTRLVNLLELLRQPDDGIFSSRVSSILRMRRLIALAAVNQDEVRKRRWKMEDGEWTLPAFAILHLQSSILVFASRFAVEAVNSGGAPPPHARKIILALDGFDFERR